MDLTIGQTIGDYEVLGVLGAGGMGKVYKVRSNISQRIEAIKVLLPDLNAQPELAERFLREIRISASLEHPNIACLRAAQRTDNQLLMVLEYVDGFTLAELMQEGPVPRDCSVEYICQALSALEYAHSRGVIHRDIKPGNIMVTAAGQAKLMDFGIARLASDARLTKTGVMVGSVYYMSPEQIEGQEVDARSDLYSLGVTFYELVTGKRPFNGDSEYQILAAHLKGAPQPPRELDQSLPAPISEIILTAIARDVKDRFSSAKAMHAALTSFTQSQAASTVSYPAQPPAPHLPPVSPTRSKGNRTLYMALGSVATLAVLIGAAIEAPNFRHARAEDKVTVQRSAPPAARPAVTLPTQPEPTLVKQQPEPEPVKVPDKRASRAFSGHLLPRPVTAPAPQQNAAEPEQQSRQQPPRVINPKPEDESQLSGLRERMMLMGARVSAVRTSLDNLRRAQAQSGLGLRSDMSATEERMLFQLQEAEASLSAHDPASAQKHLDAAETDLDKLESFFGK